MAGVYVPRSPTTGVLYGVVRQHWSAVAATVREGTDGAGLPSFVANEFRKFLRSGVLAHGFARVRCGDCTFERLLPFSCKGRGFCPSGGSVNFPALSCLGPVSRFDHSTFFVIASPCGL